MVTIRLTAVVCIFCIFFCGCSASYIYDEHTGINDPIRFGAGFIGARGPVESDSGNKVLQDVSGIQVIRGNDGLLANAGFNTRAISATAALTAGSDSMAISPLQYYNTHHDDCHFIAFYPAPSEYTGAIASYTIDGSQDIMAAPAQTARFTLNNNIAFNFIHLLARIELKVIAADDIYATNYGNLTSALVTVPNQLELSVSADGNTILSKKPSSTNLILDFGTLSLDTMDTTTSSGYMVYPDASDIATINLAFTNRPAQDYAIENLTLEAGKISVIVATVSASEINFAITLKQWQAGNGTGQDIDI